MSAPVVEARGLGKTFRSSFPRRESNVALSDLWFEIQPGEILAFLGPNGAGKTTTINLLLGFLTPTRGEARLFGLPTTERRAREALGFLPEHYAFYPFLTAPVLLHYYGRLHGIESAERRRRIDELLERVGLADARHRAVGKYSRGMRQRLGIAQALINRPRLLILDEPTSGFDPIGRRMVRDLLSELKTGGTSIFLCSHILSEVESICDQVVIIHRGRVVRHGALEDVIGAGDGYEVTYRDTGCRAAARLWEVGLAPRGAAAGAASHVVAPDEARAQRAVDAIRAAGGVILGYRSRARSLEEAFIEQVVDTPALPPEEGDGR